MRGRVLIVDDDRSVAELLRAPLARRGFEVVQAASAAEALDAIPACEPDVVVADLQMPRVGGLELCRRLAIDRPDLPEVVLTAYGSLEAAVGAIRAGAYDFIVKPPEIDALAVALDRRPLELPDVGVGDRLLAPAAHIIPPRADVVTISLRDVTLKRAAEARRLDLYSVVAHDLRAPLSAMSLRLSVLLDDHAGGLPPGVEASVVTLKARIRELLAMVDDFLQLARLESPGFALERDEVDLVAPSSRRATTSGRSRGQASSRSRSTRASGRSASRGTAAGYARC